MAGILDGLRHEGVEVVAMRAEEAGQVIADSCEMPTTQEVLGHALGLTVTAEGVETATQARRLAALGCDLGQGWHFGRPVPVPKLR